MTDYSDSDADRESGAGRLPLPEPEFNPGNIAIRVAAAILCVLLMWWMARS